MTYERKNIAKMQGYQSGEQPEDGLTIKLNTNENPYAPSPMVEDVVKNLNSENLRRYPPPTANNFRSIAAEVHQVQVNNIIATRGGDELLRLLITTYVEPGETIAMSDPSYSLYPILAQIQNCPILKIPLQDDWTLASDFADKANERHAKLTFIVNPHAPTGRLLEENTIRGLAEQLDSILLVDEAYVDFINPDIDYNCLKMVNEFDNLIFLRTLSKGYSLAGLRFGYGIAHPTLISPMLDKTRDSYNLDFFSQEIAEAALRDQSYAQQAWEKVRIERTNLAQQLEALGFYCAPSQANFLLVSPDEKRNGHAESLYHFLKQNNILVRFFNTPRLNNKLRITVGTPEENKQLIKVLKSHIKD